MIGAVIPAKLCRLCSSLLRVQRRAARIPTDARACDGFFENTNACDRRFGFIGSHLCERLLAEDHEVLRVDNYYTGRRQKQNIEHLLAHPRFEVMRHDITLSLYVEGDEIYNLACPASPVHYQFDPVQTLKTSVHGAVNMLGLAKRIKAKIFQASTSEVYGDPHVHPRPDRIGATSIRSDRAPATTRASAAESLFFDYHRQHDVHIKVARLFNTYGPRMHPDDGRVVSNFIMQALRGEPITIYGDGSQTRSFGDVDDLVDGIVRLMRSNDALQGPVNLGNPNEKSVRELAELVLDITGSRSALIFKPLPADDPKQRQPDITLARQKLNWTPKVELRDGLERTVAYFKSVVAGDVVAEKAGARTPTVKRSSPIQSEANVL